MKPLFLKVVTVEGVNCLVALPKQMHEVSGKQVAVETQIQVVPRDTEIDFTEGEIYATNSLTKTKNGWYVVGTEFYNIADEVGVIRQGSSSEDDKWLNDTHKLWCQNYHDYTTGKAYRGYGDFGTPEEPAKAVRKERTVLEKLQADRKLAPPTIEDDGWYVDRDLWYYLLRNFKKRKNTLLIGSSGTGKTELVMFMMQKIKKNINVFDMAVSNPNKAFCGNLRAENGSTWFQYARFANEIQKEGLILMDELSRAVPTANNIFLPVLDGRRTLYIEDAIKESEIKVHEDCVFWATANIGAEFVGTSTLDHALLNRFQQVGLEYPPMDKESLLLQKRFGVDKRTADTLTKVANDIRKNPDLSKDISTRQLFDIAELVADGYKPLDAFKWSVLQQFEGNEHDGGERATVLTILQSM